MSKLRLQTEGQGREVSEAWTRFLQVKPLVHGPQDFFSFSKDVPKGRGKTGSEYLGTACKTNNLGMDANVRGKKGGTAAPRPCTLLRPRDLQRKNRKVLG